MKHHLRELAINIDAAAKDVTAIPQLSHTHQFDLNEAYLIQKLSIESRLKRGDQLAGYKLGFTSKAKMEQMGVRELIWGQLTDSMAIKNGGKLDLKRFIHPRVEPEIAFRVSQKINQEITIKNVSEYFDGVAAAIEIIDSRYDNFKFSLADIIADNCSSSAYVIGQWFDSKTHFKNVNITFNINDIPCQHGNSNAILGNPVRSIIEMSRLAVKYDLTIDKGAIILAGAATSAEYVQKGNRVEAIFENLGSVYLEVI